MVRVMATGVFDLLHLGHIYYLEEAKKLGDELVVVVARDSTVRKYKREPIMNENLRLKLVQALKPVDRAVLGFAKDPYKIVERLKPDVIALGYDQFHNAAQIKKELLKRGLRVKIVRLSQYTGGTDLDGTRKIIRKIIDLWTLTKKLSKIERGRRI
jgi:FAD synthetase